jgi:ankyrin repeat protein
MTWQDNDGDTAMHWAVMKGALNAVKTLVQH